ncbi:putative non-specific lipid-transfer protein-like protein-like [Capsicum annuum]|nr:putative non-specific lipid-transfer protein-like protein-like [Capsicum annuum]
MDSNSSCTDVTHINEELPIKLEEKLKLIDKEDDYFDISLRQLNLNDVDDFMEWHADDDKVSKFSPCDAFTSKRDAITYITDVIIPDPLYRAIYLNDKPIGCVIISFFDECKG